MVRAWGSAVAPGYAVSICERTARRACCTALGQLEKAIRVGSEMMENLLAMQKLTQDQCQPPRKRVGNPGAEEGASIKRVFRSRMGRIGSR